MTANASDAVDAAQPLSDEARAAALWTFVQLKSPRFSSADALDVVRQLSPDSTVDVKTLARRLKTSLSERGISLKHTHALQAASRLAGYQGWHVGGSESARRPLRLDCHSSFLNKDLENWEEAVDAVSDYCIGNIEAGGLKTFRFKFTVDSVGILEPLLEAHNPVGRRVPLLRIVWDKADDQQLRSAVAAAERIRRRFEEGGQGVRIDGLAAIQFCLQSPHSDARRDDPLNSELVLTEVTPGSCFGEEVARGNELQCWREIATLLEEGRAEPTAPLRLEGLDWVNEEKGYRYRWSLTTLRPTGGPVPQIVTRDLTVDETARLLRRRNMAVRHRAFFIPEDTVRHMELFNSDQADVHVNWRALTTHLMSKRQSHAAVDEAFRGVTFGAVLSLREFEALMNAMDADRPETFVQTPARKDLTLLQDDGLLKALVSRVEEVECLLPRGLDDERIKKVGSLVDGLQANLRLDARDDDAPVNFIVPRHSPYLINAGQGRELLDGLTKLGLVAYGGLTTAVHRPSPREGDANQEPPVRAARALLLDIDFATAPTLQATSKGAEVAK